MFLPRFYFLIQSSRLLGGGGGRHSIPWIDIAVLPLGMDDLRRPGSRLGKCSLWRGLGFCPSARRQGGGDALVMVMSGGGSAAEGKAINCATRGNGPYRAWVGLRDGKGRRKNGIMPA